MLADDGKSDFSAECLGSPTPVRRTTALHATGLLSPVRADGTAAAHLASNLPPPPMLAVLAEIFTTAVFAVVLLSPVLAVLLSPVLVDAPAAALFALVHLPVRFALCSLAVASLTHGSQRALSRWMHREFGFF